MTTSIVILNWNGRDFLKKYLPCLLESVEGCSGIEVVVADNASSDDSLQLLRSEFPQVKLITFNKNHGFAKGYNKALHQLQSDLFLLINSDVEVGKGWLDPLLEWMQFHPDCGICGPVLHQIADRDKFEYAGAAGGYLDRFCYPFCRGRVMHMTETDTGQYPDPEEVMWVSGAALLVRSEVFFTLGGFCEDFFAHMEEIDLCWRARLEGWKVNIVPRSTVYHVGGGSLPPDSPFKLYLNFRNNLLMMSRCLPKTYAVYNAYAFMGVAINPEEGPDMVHNCNAMYLNEYDPQTQEDVLLSSANLALYKTGFDIFTRMVLDGLSAITYLLTFRPACFKAVVSAHKDFRKLRRRTSPTKLKNYLKGIVGGEKDYIARNILCTAEDGGANKGGKVFRLKGIWSRWIVMQSILKKEAIFAETNNIR